jgi:hypothetical protein
LFPDQNDDVLEPLAPMPNAFDDARLAVNVLREVEDRRLALAQRTITPTPRMVA